jgi:hypothetical protein
MIFIRCWCIFLEKIKNKFIENFALEVVKKKSILRKLQSSKLLIFLTFCLSFKIFFFILRTLFEEKVNEFPSLRLIHNFKIVSKQRPKYLFIYLFI